MPETDIWFPFYYGDYLKDTMQLSAERHGIYLLLMIHCWQNGHIEDDIDSVAMIAKVQPDSKSLTYILAKYFVKKDDKYYQNRVTKERECAEENKKKRSEKARKAAEARWNNNATSNATSMPDAMLQGMPKPCPSPSPSPSQSNSSTQSTTSERDKAKRKRFTPPSLDEVKEQCIIKKYKVIPDKFFYHYESNGWKVGKNKMVDWKKALAGWESRESDFSKPEKQDNHQRGGVNFEY